MHYGKIVQYNSINMTTASNIEEWLLNKNIFWALLENTKLHFWIVVAIIFPRGSISVLGKQYFQYENIIFSQVLEKIRSMFIQWTMKLFLGFKIQTLKMYTLGTFYTYIKFTILEWI